MKVYNIFATFLVCCLYLCISCGNAFADSQTAESIEQATKIIEKWVDTQRIISKEKQEWQLAKEMLNERVKLVESEISSLREKIQEAEKNIAEADKKRAEMVEENQKLKDASVVLGDIIAPIENKTSHLITKLPDPIADRIKPLSQRLPQDPNNVKQSISERYQNIVGILNEVDKFNREMSLTSEVRNLSDGSSVEVAAMYIGIGQAYFVSANQTVAGIGTAIDNKWVWIEDNQPAKDIADAISIMKNEKVAEFIKLPLEIK